MNFKWFSEHWAILSSIAASIVFCVVAVADEYAVYSSVKEAVVAQKTFNQKHERAVMLYSADAAEMKAKQERIDERTTLMLKMLESIDQRIK